MTAEEALVQLLASSSAIQGWVQGRVYHECIPSEPPTRPSADNSHFPCIVYELLSRGRLKHLSGNSALAAPRYRVTYYSKRSRFVRSIGAAIAALAGQQSVYGGAVDWVDVGEEVDVYSPPTEQQEEGIRGATVELTLWYRG